MPIKINGQTSGSVTLSAPNTGSDVTLSLPGSNLDLAAIPQANISNLTTDLASKLPIAGGKILQIVRATDNINRQTTSTSLTDVTGMSVTITPQKNNSAILLITKALGFQTFTSPNSDNRGQFQITDSSNNQISGAQSIMGQTGSSVGTTFEADVILIGWSTPATINATTYKTRFRSFGTSTTGLRNGQVVGQMYAIEVSA
jgi:hypothetical protein